jgi:hypothetical protein
MKIFIDKLRDFELSVDSWPSAPSIARLSPHANTLPSHTRNTSSTLFFCVFSRLVSSTYAHTHYHRVYSPRYAIVLHPTTHYFLSSTPLLYRDSSASPTSTATFLFFPRMDLGSISSNFLWFIVKTSNRIFLLYHIHFFFSSWCHECLFFCAPSVVLIEVIPPTFFLFPPLRHHHNASFMT